MQLPHHVYRSETHTSNQAISSVAARRSRYPLICTFHPQFTSTTSVVTMVSSHSFQFSATLLATVAARVTPLETRGTIGSDDIVGFPQTVPSGTTGTVYLAYQPHLYVVNGCVPFPAVDAEGDTKYVHRFSNSKLSKISLTIPTHSAGLATTGSSNGECSSSTGQIYVRGSAYNGYYALMYAW